MKEKNFKTLKLKYDNYILIVTLNRPEFKNAINIDMMHDLYELWQTIYVEHTDIRCIVLTGSDNAFCAGADLKARMNMDLDTWRMQHSVLEQAIYAMLDCPVPIIAAVNGPAFGGGLELVLLCDFAYAANTATFAQSEVRIGLMPGALGTQNLPRGCGIRRAKELAFTGATFSAEDAYRWGIINKVCSPENLMQEVLLTANKIVENAPFAVKQTKKSLAMSQQLDVKAGYVFELEAYNQLLPTKDREEGIRAFNEKRKPVFSGE